MSEVVENQPGKYWATPEEIKIKTLKSTSQFLIIYCIFMSVRAFSLSALIRRISCISVAKSEFPCRNAINRGAKSALKAGTCDFPLRRAPRTKESG